MTKVILSTPTKDTSGINMDMKFIDVHVSSAVNVDISISVIVEAELNLGLDNALTASLKIDLSRRLSIFFLWSKLYNERVSECIYLYKKTSVRLLHSNMP